MSKRQLHRWAHATKLARRILEQREITAPTLLADLASLEQWLATGCPAPPEKRSAAKQSSELDHAMAGPPLPKCRHGRRLLETCAGCTKERDA